MSGFFYCIYFFWEVNIGSVKDFRIGIEKYYLWIWYGNYVVKMSGIQLIEIKVVVFILYLFLYFLNVVFNLNYLDLVFIFG